MHASETKSLVAGSHDLHEPERAGGQRGRIWVSTRPPAADVIVICDDLNLPSGKLRLRAAGTAEAKRGFRTSSISWEPLRSLGSVSALDVHPLPSTQRTMFWDDSVPRSVLESIRRVPQLPMPWKLWVQKGIDAAMNKF